MTSSDSGSITRAETSGQVLDVLEQFDHAFPRSISSRVGALSAHAEKLAERAQVFVARQGGAIVGFVAFYANDTQTRIGFLSHVAVDQRVRGQGIGLRLLRVCLDESKLAGMASVKLEVDVSNRDAIAFYESQGFAVSGAASPDSCYMVIAFP